MSKLIIITLSYNRSIAIPIVHADILDQIHFLNSDDWGKTYTLDNEPLEMKIMQSDCIKQPAPEQPKEQEPVTVQPENAETVLLGPPSLSPLPPPNKDE